MSKCFLYGAGITVKSSGGIPEFTYTGYCEIVNDADEEITKTRGNWKIRFLTSGTLTFTDLKGAENGVDVFLVGGGGGGGYGRTFASGGGGGYTATEKGVAVSVNTPYEIVVGDGGVSVNSTTRNYGGKSSAFGFSVDGGYSGVSSSSRSAGGGSGGSGGGAGMVGGDDHVSGDGHGGEDGADGGDVKHGSYTGNGGKGQGTTTREFGESTGKLYAGGGGGGASMGYIAYPPGVGGAGGGGDGGQSQKIAEPGEPNTGGGGGGAAYGQGVSGGSGIVIIRNARG